MMFACPRDSGGDREREDDDGEARRLLAARDKRAPEQVLAAGNPGQNAEDHPVDDHGGGQRNGEDNQADQPFGRPAQPVDHGAGGAVERCGQGWPLGGYQWEGTSKARNGPFYWRDRSIRPVPGGSKSSMLTSAW